MVKSGLLKIVNSVNPLTMKTLLMLLLIITMLLLVSILHKKYKSRENFGSATPAQPGTTQAPIGTVPDKRSVEVFLFLDYKKPVLTNNGKFIDNDWPELVIKYKNYPNVKIEKKPVSSMYNYFKTNPILAEIFKNGIADPVTYPPEVYSNSLAIAYVESRNGSLIRREFSALFRCKPTDINTTMKSVDEAIKSTLSANRV